LKDIEPDNFKFQAAEYRSAENYSIKSLSPVKLTAGGVCMDLKTMLKKGIKDISDESEKEYKGTDSEELKRLGRQTED
jgi:hypothetical protein